VTGRQGRKRMKLLDDFKERRGFSHLKEETLDRTMWRTGFGRGFGHVVRQTTKGMNTFINVLHMFRAVRCSYSGRLIVSMQYLISSRSVGDCLCTA